MVKARTKKFKKTKKRTAELGYGVTAGASPRRIARVLENVLLTVFSSTVPSRLPPGGRLRRIPGNIRSLKAFEESTQRQPCGFEHVESMRDVITASQAAIVGISSTFTASQVAREEVDTTATAFFE